MNPFYVKKKDETHETRSDNEDECIPECITTSSSSRSSCLPTPKTPKPIAGIPVPRLELWSSNSESNSYNSDNDIEPELNVKNIKMPSLQDTPGQVLEYIEEINSMNEVLTMKVKSLNVHVQVLHSREDDCLNENNELKGTIKELTEELELVKGSKRFNGNSFGQTASKPAAAIRKVTNENYDKATRFVKKLESKNANTQLSNQTVGRIETTMATQTKKPTVVKISKTKAVKIRQKQSEVKITKPKAVKISPPQKATEVKVSKPKFVKIRQKQNDLKILKPKDGEIAQKQVEVNVGKLKAMIPQKLTDVKIIKPKDAAISQTPTDVKVKAAVIPQKIYETVNHKSNETVATITAKLQSATTKTLSSQSLKEPRGTQNASKLSKSTLATETSQQDSADKKILLPELQSATTKTSSSQSLKESRGRQNASKLSKSTLPTESTKQGSAENKLSLPELSFSKNRSSRYSTSTPEIVTSRTGTTSNSTMHTDFNEFVYSSEFSSPQSSEALTPTSITGELSVYSCSSPELKLQKRFEGGHKTAQATRLHSTSSPDISYSIKKISSVNSNHTIIKNVKKHGSLLPSLNEYPNINPESSATLPKIKSTSSVFESPQRRFQIAKKIGAAPLPNPMKELPSLSGQYNPKPPASPRPNTKKIKLPSLQSQTKFYKRQD